MQPRPSLGLTKVKIQQLGIFSAALSFLLKHAGPATSLLKLLGRINVNVFSSREGRLCWSEGILIPSRVMWENLPSLQIKQAQMVFTFTFVFLYETYFTYDHLNSLFSYFVICMV